MRTRYPVDRSFGIFSRFSPPFGRGIFVLARAALSLVPKGSRGVSVRRVTVAGKVPVRAFLISPKGEKRKLPCLVYFHGGGFVFKAARYHYRNAAAYARTGCRVLLVDYRLAPEHPYPAAIEDGQAAWDYLMRHGFGARDVILAGDSAGGNLALVLCLGLKDEGRLLPGALLLMSPWTDMTMTGESLSERADIDPVLTPEYMRAVREAYAGGLDPAQPCLTPLNGDFAGFPPTLIQVGTHELLYSDAERLAGRMKAAGAECRLEVWENMWHDFQMYPSKTAANAMQNMAYFLLEQC